MDGVDLWTSDLTGIQILRHPASMGFGLNKIIAMSSCSLAVKSKGLQRR